MNQKTLDSYPNHLHLPTRAARVGLDHYRDRMSSDIRVGWGVPDMDEYLIPMGPGDLTSILGRPGHTKTTMAIHLARHAEEEFRATSDDLYVMYATWETLVEEFVAIYTSDQSGQTLADIGRGRADMGRITDALSVFIDRRLVVVGRSLEKDSNGRLRGSGVPNLNDVIHALKWMQDSGRRVGILILDYLQRIPAIRGKERSDDVTENLEISKDIGLSFGIPVVDLIQAKREVDNYKGLQLPGLGDGQWTSSIEQTSDKVLSQTRPIIYLDVGNEIELPDGRIYIVRANTVATKVLKQRWGPAGATFINDLDVIGFRLSTAVPMQNPF